MEITLLIIELTPWEVRLVLIGFCAVVRGHFPWTNLRSAKRNLHSPSLEGISGHFGFRLAFKQITEPPINLNSLAQLTVSENQPIDTIVGEFNATDPDGESRYEIISGVEMSWQEAREDALSRGGHWSPLLLRKKII